MHLQAIVSTVKFFPRGPVVPAWSWLCLRPVLGAISVRDVNSHASGPAGGADDIFRKGRSPLVLHDVQAGAAPVGAVANAVPVDEHVGRMQDDRPIGTRVDQFLRSRRHAGADLDRTELVADVVNPHSRVLVGGEDQRGTLETARPVLVNVMRPQMSTDRDIVPVVWLRESGDADR